MLNHEIRDTKKILQGIKEEISKSVAIAGDNVSLNVGGATDGFTVKRELLCKVKGSVMENVFNGQ